MRPSKRCWNWERGPLWVLTYFGFDLDVVLDFFDALNLPGEFSRSDYPCACKISQWIGALNCSSAKSRRFIQTKPAFRIRVIFPNPPRVAVLYFRGIWAFEAAPGIFVCMSIRPAWRTSCVAERSRSARSLLRTSYEWPNPQRSRYSANRVGCVYPGPIDSEANMSFSE
jgi:hypothetical protein